jgi:hypothetical protein
MIGLCVLESNAKLSGMATFSPGWLKAAWAPGASAATTEMAARMLRRKKVFFMVEKRYGEGTLSGSEREERKTRREGGKR